MRIGPGIAFLLALVAFWLGAGLPMLVAQVPPREAHGLATFVLAITLGFVLARLLPADLSTAIGKSLRLWLAAAFTVSLVSSTFTTALVWATLRGL